MKLKQSELLLLFFASVENAKSLLNASQHLLTKYKGGKHPSLGLAELALEELGKSYTCLSYYSKAEIIEDWKTFWKEWKNHNLKAHRAFFYEFFCLMRVELNSQKHKENFPTLRDKISREKELSFYVDIDRSNRKIYVPAEEIEEDECANRLLSILGLLNASFHVKDWLKSDKSQHFKNAISDYAFLTITTGIYTQNVEFVLKNMRTNNIEYNEGLEAIWELFNPNENN